MRRRRPEQVERATREKPPLWLHNMSAGFRHVSGRSMSDSITTDNLTRDRALLHAAQARWCAENGCYRQGKTCREAYGVVPERCRQAGGPAEQGETEGEGQDMPLKVGEVPAKPAIDGPDRDEEPTSTTAEAVEVDVREEED